MCICTISVCIESSSIDIPLEEKADGGLLEGEGERGLFGKMCVTCAVLRETSVDSGSAVLPVWEWSRS